MSIPHVRPVRRALAAVAAAGALILVPAAAHAESWSYKDGAGDVQVFDETSETGTVAPNREAGDVRKVRITHGSSRIGIRFTMRKSPSNYMYFYALRTSAGDFELARMRLGGESQVLLTKAGKTKELPCDGIEWTVKKSPASVSVAVPRSCVGNPRWVRVGIGVVSFADSGMYGDDALHRDLLDRQPLSPRIRRG